MSSPAPRPEFFALQHAVAGRYSLEREIGRGGMGIVFLARDVALDRPVAIKLLPPTMAADATTRARFLREARTAARLSHPHIVPIHAVDKIDDLVFYVMAFVDGETLGERVRRAGPLPPAEALRVTQEVAWALGHAHARGVIHRDVKPDNVLLERGSGRALVTDFGIARAVEGATPVDGTAIGTPAYMSPEQAAGEAVDARSDVYSLGVTMFYATAGRLPFEANTALAMIARHATELAPPLLAARPTLPVAFARTIDRALEKSPAARWADADAMAAAIADARGTLVESPRPVLAFVHESDAAGLQLGTALVAALVAMVWASMVHDFLGILQAVLLIGAFLTVGLAVARIAQLVAGARRLLAGGYGHDAVRAALARGGEDMPRVQPSVRVRVAGTVAAAALSAGSYALVSADVPFGLDLLGVLGMIAVPVWALQWLWGWWWTGERGVWRRMLNGAPGRALFRLARSGRAPAPVVPAAGEPTVVALGRAAESLFAELPPADQARLGDVPALLAQLQRDAVALRARGDADAEARHGVAVAAIEAVRLDLLRMQMGAGSLDELTRHVEAARELGARVDAELAGREEVQRLLRADTPTPA